MTTVLVSLGSSNTIPLTEELNRNVFLTVLEAGKSKIKVPPNLVPDENSLLGLQMASFSLCPYIGQRESISLFFFKLHPHVQQWWGWWCSVAQSSDSL